MEVSLKLTLLFAISILAVLCNTTVTTVEGLEAATTSTPPPAPHEFQEQSSSHTALLLTILSQHGFHKLAAAAPSLSDSASASITSSWSGPSTIFAPSDASLRTCFSCSIPNLLREHIVPGLFTVDYLRRLAFGTKIETLSPGRCITVTSDTVDKDTNTNATANVFIGGAEITQPDLFNNGMVVIHGLQSFISPLSPFSCDIERMTALSFPFHPDHRSGAGQNIQASGSVEPTIMRLMLREAMLRLRNNGFSVLALAMKVKYAELVTLQNMTVFAVDDLSIFSGSHSYISNVKFHIVPNHFLSISDLEKLPVGTPLPTLEHDQSLLITTSGGGVSSAPMRINYVRIKVPDVIRNVKIIVHSVYLPFPHINPVAAAFDSILGGEEGPEEGAEAEAYASGEQTTEGMCTATDSREDCAETPMPPVKPLEEIEDHHGF